MEFSASKPLSILQRSLTSQNWKRPKRLKMFKCSNVLCKVCKEASSSVSMELSSFGGSPSCLRKKFLILMAVGCDDFATLKPELPKKNSVLEAQGFLLPLPFLVLTFGPPSPKANYTITIRQSRGSEILKIASK